MPPDAPVITATLPLNAVAFVVVELLMMIV